MAPIGGGLVGCEMALDYAQEGKKVTVVESLPKILSAGIPSPIPNGQIIPDLFKYRHVNILEGHKLAAVENGKAVLECSGQKKELDADSIVVAVGFRPAPSMAQELAGCGLLSMRLATGGRSAQFSTPCGTAMRSATIFNQYIRQDALYKIIMQFLRRNSP